MATATGYSNAEVKAGVFLTLCLGLFVAMLFIYGKLARVWKGRQEISVVFNSVTALRPEAPVRYNGVEVGRVKEIKILHLNDANISRLPPLSRKDLENLPLTDAEVKALRITADKHPDDPSKFKDEVQSKLLNRTMIRLTLEVLKERDSKRYRVDDAVNISTTLMGDTSVEISSGTREAVDPEKGVLLLGHSGDFFTNLAKSVEQVKEILGSVSDLVGEKERESVRKSLRRFDAITERIENIVTVAQKRLPPTWDKVDDLADNARSNLTRVGDSITAIQPQIKSTLSNADDAVKDVQTRVGALTDEARSAVVDVKGQVKPIFADLHEITAKTKDDIPVMVRNARDLASRLQQSAGKLDIVLGTGNRLLTESYPDMRRLILAFRLGAENFEEATNVVKRKPWLVYHPAKEGDAINSAQRTAQSLEVATRRFAELSTEFQSIRRNMENAPKEQLDRVDFILQELNILSDTLKFAGEVSRKEVLPPFVRKKDGFIQNVEEFDPTLGRKKKEGNP